MLLLFLSPIFFFFVVVVVKSHFFLSLSLFLDPAGSVPVICGGRSKGVLSLYVSRHQPVTGLSGVNCRFIYWRDIGDNAVTTVSCAAFDFCFTTPSVGGRRGESS